MTAHPDFGATEKMASTMMRPGPLQDREHVLCGNPKHPDGPWHPARGLPYPGEWREAIRQWWRNRKWGCPCPRKIR